VPHRCPQTTANQKEPGEPPALFAPQAHSPTRTRSLARWSPPPRLAARSSDRAGWRRQARERDDGKAPAELLLGCGCAIICQMAEGTACPAVAQLTRRDIERRKPRRESIC